MSFNLKVAAEYVRQRVETGQLTPEDIARLTESFQRLHGLAADGMPGPMTISALRPAPLRKAYPLRQLPDGRRPRVTSGFRTRNPSRPDHQGCDWFYPYDPTSDPPVEVGDGGATRGPDGKPKWFIPEGEEARAMASGWVSLAGPSPTGWRVWIEHGDGHRSGYFHLRNVRVEVGDYVEIGSRLGEIGDNPNDRDAEHLHTEVSPIDVYRPIDPEIWLGEARFIT